MPAGRSTSIPPVMPNRSKIHPNATLATSDVSSPNHAVATDNHFSAIAVDGCHVRHHVHGYRTVDHTNKQESRHKQPEARMLAQHLPADRNVDLRQGMTAFLFRRGDLLIAHFGTKRQQALFRRFGTEENHRNRQCGHQYRQFHGNIFFDYFRK